MDHEIHEMMLLHKMPESTDCTLSMKDVDTEYIPNDNVAKIYKKMAQERKMGSIWDF